MRIALVKNGVVDNIAEWDGQAAWNPGDEYTKVNVDEITCEIGYTYDGETFTKPVVP